MITCLHCPATAPANALDWAETEDGFLCPPCQRAEWAQVVAEARERARAVCEPEAAA